MEITKETTSFLRFSIPVGLRLPEAEALPFKSKAQRRKFAELLVEGKISPDTYEEWNRETGSKELPERAAKNTAAKKTATKRTAAKKTAASKRAKTKRR